MLSASSGRSDCDLESEIAGFVRTYIRVHNGADSSEAQDALRWVCAALERLLGRLLQRQNDGYWSGWVDGIIPRWDLLPDAVKVHSPLELTVRGAAICGENARGPFWIEPFGEVAA